MSVLSKKIWEIKYQPKTVQECILPKDTKERFQGFVDKGEFPNLLLMGPAGTGKTTVAMALCNELDYEVLMINGSNEGRLFETLRNKITSFASTISLSGQKKCVLIDEADYVPSETVQPALRNFISEFSKSEVRFIFTCNYPERIIEPLHSRCAVIDFKIDASDKLNMMAESIQRCKEILNKESIKFNDDVLIKFVKQYFPDLRRLINELQYKTSSGELTSSSLTAMTSSDLKNLTRMLANKSAKELREWVATQPHASVDRFANELYSNLYDVCDTSDMPSLIIIIGEWMYKSKFMSDSEIACMAFFVNIMTDVTIKELK